MKKDEVRGVIVDMRCRICDEITRVLLRTDGNNPSSMVCPRCHYPYFNEVKDWEMADVRAKIGLSSDPATLLEL